MSDSNLAAVARLTNALSRATRLDEVYDAALDGLQSSLGVDRASILLFDDSAVMSFVAWRGLSESYRSAVRGHTPWTRSSTDVEPICVSDHREDPSLAGYHDTLESEGIRALAFFPLVHRDSVIGKFMLYYGEPHAFLPREVDLARAIATQIAFGVARIQSELELQRERDRLNDIIASIPGVVWETVDTADRPRRLTFVSDYVEKLLGYPAGEWYRNPSLGDEVVVERGIESIGADANEQAAGAALNRYRMRAADGRLVWVEARTAAKRRGDEVVTRGVTMDITSQVESERRTAFLNEASALLASSLNYERTLEHLAQLVVGELGDWCAIDVREDEGIVRRLSVVHRDPAKRAAAERMKAIQPERQRTRFINEAIESAKPILIDRIDWDAFESRYADDPEIVAAHRDLGLTSYMVVPLLAGGRSFGALSMVSADPRRLFDEHDLALAAELGRRAGYAVDNARLYRQAQEANRAKDEFLATLSHELRTPMTSTLGWAMMLGTQELPPETFRLAIETIERSTRAQAKLIDDILDVSRIVTGKLRLNVLPLNPRSVIESAVDAVRPAAIAKHLEIRVAVAETAVPLGDPARMQQVIWNLLSNAVKFTPPGGAIDIVVDQASSEHVRIQVSDTGTGIPRKLLPHIFERFRQGDSSSTRSHGGLGLGLAIVKSLVELHGGTVTAQSEGEGRGTSFTILLPVANAELPAPMMPAAEHSAPLELAGISVLLVEDEDDTRYMLSAALQNYGARVIAVRSVSDAFAAMASNTPTVVVSDIGMPGDDGYNLIMRIRAGTIAHVRNVPAIALTAYASPDDRQRALSAGFGFHLAKPVDPMIVVKTVREAAGR